MWTRQRPDGEQMWEGRRSGTEPEQLGDIKNKSIPRDWGNYRGVEWRGLDTGTGKRSHVNRERVTSRGFSLCLSER